MKKIVRIVLTIGCLMHPWLSLQAADIAGDVRLGNDGPDTTDGGFLEVGIIGKAHRDPRLGDRWDKDPALGLVVAGQYRYKGFFLESVNGSSDGLNAGYNLWSDERWAVDVIGLNSTWGDSLEDFEEIDPNLGDTQRTIWLLKRDTPLTGAGVRITGYFGEYILQYRALNDIYYNRGNYSTARLGRSWQYRNWNFHGIVGLEYLDAKYSQRTFGVDEREASRSFPTYAPGATVSTEVEAGVTYPITEHWVFRATVKHRFLPNAVKESPLYDDDSATSLLTSFSYVF